jgi:hypothetical protein
MPTGRNALYKSRRLSHVNLIERLRAIVIDKIRAILCRRALSAGRALQLQSNAIFRTRETKNVWTVAFIDGRTLMPKGPLRMTLERYKANLIWGL